MWLQSSELFELFQNFLLLNVFWKNNVIILCIELPGCQPSYQTLLSVLVATLPENTYLIKITDRLKKKFSFLTNAGHVLLLVCSCRVFVCHVEGIVLCIKIICAICFLRFMFVFLLVYTRLIFCIYLYECLSGKISWISSTINNNLMADSLCRNAKQSLIRF